MRLFFPFLLALLLVPACAHAGVKTPKPRPATAQEAELVGPPAPEKTANRDAGAAEGEDATLPAAEDLDEGLPLPPYPAGARHTMGRMQTWVSGEEDTLLDIARHFDLGYVEMRAANPEVDAWALPPGTELEIPSFRLLPRAKQEGIVVNLAEMRLYHFREPGKPPVTYPIGIGRDGLMTPTGETRIERKVAYPTWRPTARMRAEHPYYPESVPPGPMNPLGTHALYLGWPEFRIHGSNKPWAIGRRVSSGCMRMYPEDIIALYNAVPENTKVTVVEQPILVAWQGRKLWIEAVPSRKQSNQLEIDDQFKPKPLTDALRAVIEKAAGKKAEGKIDWKTVEKAVLERRGIPVVIADLDNGKTARAEDKEPLIKPEDEPYYNP